MSANSLASRICLGTAQIGMQYGIANRHGRPDDARCDALLTAAIDQGVLRWDTACCYGDAETRIGNYLAGCSRRDDVQIVSKLSQPPKGLPQGALRRWVSEQIDASRKKLRVDHLAGWLIHDPAALLRYGQALWDALRWQVDRGAAQQIGLSVYDPEELRDGLALPEVSAVQLPLNLWDHRFARAGLLDECVRRHVTTYARSSLLQGVFTMTPEELATTLPHLSGPLQQLHEVLADYALEPLDVALAHVLDQDSIRYVVLGVDDERQLQDNLTRAAQTLPAGLDETLQQVFGPLSVEVLEPRRWQCRESSG